jgi:hypothetical protein
MTAAEVITGAAAVLAAVLALAAYITLVTIWVRARKEGN